MNSTPVRPGAEPFFLERPGETACLLIHGFKGSPYEMRPLGAHLAACGITVMGVRLPGHGTNPMDMGRYTYRDWLSAADTGLERLLSTKRHVFVSGLSMGGTIALNLASRFSEHPHLRGVITICAPVQLVPSQINVRSTLELAFRWYHDGRRGQLATKNTSNHYRRDNYREDRVFALNSVLELLALLRLTRARLCHVTSPILVVQSRNDPVVLPFNARLILDGVQSQDSELVWLHRSYHVATLDYDGPEVSRVATDWMRQRADPLLPAAGQTA